MEGKQRPHGGKGVVGGLPLVDMVVWMHDRFVAERASQDLDRPICDDLICVHVALRPAACVTLASIFGLYIQSV